MPRGEPKVMFAVRLPSELVERVLELARETDASKTEITEQLLSEGLDRARETRDPQG